MLTQYVLRAHSITQHYRSGSEDICILSDVSLALQAGESCAIMGPSGSGKTTLLSILAGLQRPTKGQVELMGQDLSALSDDQISRLRGKQCGFVFQSYQLLPTLTALENVLVPLDILGRPDRSIALALLEQVGLKHRVHHYPSQLSGGEQQRVALARAFVHRPALIYADEPTGSLDRASADRVLEILFELNQEYGVAILLVTHDPKLAQRLTRKIELQDGRIMSHD